MKYSLGVLNFNMSGTLWKPDLSNTFRGGAILEVYYRSIGSNVTDSRPGDFKMI